MTRVAHRRLNTWSASLGRALLRRLDAPRKAYEKRIVNNMDNLYRVIRKRTIKACLGGCTEYEVICSGMIAKAFQQVSYPIAPALLPAVDFEINISRNPYGASLIMRHYSRIVPKDFDLSPNFEIVKYNIIGMSGFDYRSIWVQSGPHTGQG